MNTDVRQQLMNHAIKGEKEEIRRIFQTMEPFLFSTIAMEVLSRANTFIERGNQVEDITDEWMMTIHVECMDEAKRRGIF